MIDTQHSLRTSPFQANWTSSPSWRRNYCRTVGLHCLRFSFVSLKNCLLSITVRLQIESFLILLGPLEGPSGAFWVSPNPSPAERFYLDNCALETQQQLTEKRQTAQLSVGSVPGRAPELECDCEQLVTAATTVCLDDDVSASELQSHRAVRLQQTLSNEERVDPGCVWETV